MEELNPQKTTLEQAESSSAQLSLLSLAEHPAITKNSELLSSGGNQLVQDVKNVGSVYLQVLPGVPAAIAEQIKSDCLDHSGATLLKIGEAAALALASSLLLARSPVLAKTLLAGAGIGTSALMLENAVSFTGMAALASNPEEQSRLAASGKLSIGKLGAGLIETAPGLLAGTSGGLMLSSRVAALDSLAVSVRNVGEYGARRLVPEGFHYLSLDAKSTSALASGPEGELNLAAASRQWLESTPWRGVEEGRFFKAAGSDTIKASSRISGEEEHVFMGKSSENMFHTHEKALLPTSGDFNSVRSTGVIGIPQEGILTYYEGTGSQAQNLVRLIKSGKMSEAAAAAESLQARTFNSIVVDPAKELAVRVDMRWNGSLNRMEPSSVHTLNFSDTVNKLSKWNGRLNIDAIQSSADALLKPGMTDLLRKLTPSN